MDDKNEIHHYQQTIDYMINSIINNEQHLFNEIEWLSLQSYQILDCNIG